MKAIVLRQFGGPEELRFEDVETPRPGPGEALIRVAAVSVNRGFDISFRKGLYARGGKLPAILGADPVGVIESLGADVAGFAVGDRVAVMSTIACLACGMCRRGQVSTCEHSQTIGVHRAGGYAEHVTAPARNLARIPDGLDFATAMVVARHGSAAYNFLVKRGGLNVSDHVLITGASGALGGFCVQVAKAAGARVIAAAGADARVEAALALGADVGINYRREDLTARVREITGGRGVDLAFESSADAELFPKVVASLGQGGRLVSSGAHAGNYAPLDVKALYGRRLKLIGAAGTDVADLDWALDAASRGKLSPQIDRGFPLAEAAQAHRYVEDAAPHGKVYLSV